MRLWFLKSCLASSEEVKRFQPLLQELLADVEVDDSQDFLVTVSQVLSHWVLTAQWQPLVQTFEIMLQFLPRDDRATIVQTLQAQWPQELTLSEEGFLYYQEKPVLKYLSEQGTTPSVSEPVAPSKVVSRKETFQKMRQHRLRLLKNWESI